MKKPIHTIIIERYMYASRTSPQMSRNTMVSVHRGGKCKNYHTEPFTQDEHGISNASVLRAKRAQLALIEQATKSEVK